MDTIYSKEELKDRLSEIHQSGYIVSLRKGNTGIGYTLETLLGVVENNLRSPDLGNIELKETLLGVAENNLRYSDLRNIELKSRRMKSTSLLTMFTFNDSIWKIEQEALIKQYGYYKDGRWALYTTAKNKPNNRGFYVKVEQDTVRLYHEDGLCAIEWQLAPLIDDLKKKLSNVLLVEAESRKSGAIEEFWYKEAYLLTGVIVEKFLEYIKNGPIVVDLRMHIAQNGVVRNHGTAFRLHRRYWDSCFNNTERLL